MRPIPLQSLVLGVRLPRNAPGATDRGRSLKVAFVTPELQSLVRRTSLAAVAESLAVALCNAGCDTRIFLAWTRDLDTQGLTRIAKSCEVLVPDTRVGQGPRSSERFEVTQAKLKDLPVYLFGHPELFGSRSLYGDDQGPYADNWRRYALFSRAVLASFAALDFAPDVIHCLDWTTGLLPLYQKLEYVDPEIDHPAARAGTYFAIHNLAMQGAFEREILPHIGLPHRLFKHVGGIELGGKVNYLKAGVEFATIVGTHSPGHALRIQERDRGYGLEESFQQRKKELVGITNGIDYQAWDPANDPVLPAAFSAKDKELKGKLKCKSVLQQRLKLDSGPRTPVACAMGRWDQDGGFDILAEILTPLLERGVELVVMGSGSPEIQTRLKTMETTFLGRCRVIDGYQPQSAHLVMGGSDLMILPSHYNPSNPLYAIGMRYGVVPILYKGSGLQDIVGNYLEDTRKGLGFHFEPYTSEGLITGVDNALKVYKSADAWKTLLRRCLAQDYSWSATAEEYMKAYRRVTRRSRSRLEAG